MRNRWLGVAAVALVGLGWSAGRVFSQDMGGGKAEGGGAPAAGEAPAGPSAEEMAAWMAYMTPGKEHERLAFRIGEWKCSMKTWMAPGAEPTVEEGTAKVRSLLGGRFITQEFTGNHMGMPYEGVGLMGYDNSKKAYVSTWADNMGTGILAMEGSADAEGKVITTKGTMPNPLGGTCGLRIVETEKDADTYVMEMYMTMPDQPESRVMEMTYTRVKSATPAPAPAGGAK